MIAVFQGTGWFVIDEKSNGFGKAFNDTIKIHNTEISENPPNGMDKLRIWGYPVLNAPTDARCYDSNELVLYHGTSVDSLYQILEHGFRTPECKQRPECARGGSGCRCHMMGRCLYFSGFEKALRHARKTSFGSLRKRGAVLRVTIDTLRCKIATNNLCPCSCKKPYVDHAGSWMGEYDSMFIRDRSLPAARVSEWCVKNPYQVRILDYQIYNF